MERKKRDIKIKKGETKKLDDGKEDKWDRKRLVTF